MSEKVLILYSGGADSRLMIELAKISNKTVYCLLVDYEQLHTEELVYAKNHLDELGIGYYVVQVRGMNINSGLTGDGFRGRFEGVNEWHVPGRNTMFLGLALSMAESLDCDVIWHGADFSDRLNLFPDCYQDYVVKANEVCQIAGSKPIRYEAPLMGMTKELILSILENMNITKENIHSGYGKLEVK